MNLCAVIRHSTELHQERVDRHDGRAFGSTQSGNRSCRTTRGSDPTWCEERVTPSSLMPLPTGKRGSRSEDTSPSSTARDATGTSTVRLRVTWRKSAYFAL